MNRDLLDYQDQYLNQPYERFQVKFRKRKVLEILEKYNHKFLLEIGCGLEPIFLDSINFETLVIVEPANLFYENAINKLAEFNYKNKVTIYKKLLENVTEDLAQNTFDFILLSSLLHEIPNQIKFIKSLHYICNSDTIVHVNVPNAKSFHRLLALEMGLIKTEYEKSESNIQFQQNTVFDLEHLKKMFIDNGFEVIEEGSYSFKPFTHKQMEQMIQSNIITEQTLNGFYKMEKYMQNLGSEIYINVRKTIK